MIIMLINRAIIFIENTSFVYSIALHKIHGAICFRVKTLNSLSETPTRKVYLYSNLVFLNNPSSIPLLS
jgi:hypothetical protein